MKMEKAVPLNEIIMQEINQYYYDILTARINIIKKREDLLDKYIAKFGLLN